MRTTSNCVRARLSNSCSLRECSSAGALSFSLPHGRRQTPGYRVLRQRRNTPADSRGSFSVNRSSRPVSFGTSNIRCNFGLRVSQSMRSTLRLVSANASARFDIKVVLPSPAPGLQTTRTLAGRLRPI